MDYEMNGANINKAEQFTNFNFAQSVVKILDNMGFAAATNDALELLTGMTARYFEDLCLRIARNTEHGRRQHPSLGDVAMAFQAQNVSLNELNDYMQQVRNLPPPPTMPIYPVQRFDMVESETDKSRIFLADPWANEIPTVEEVEEKYGKKKANEASSFIQSQPVEEKKIPPKPIKMEPVIVPEDEIVFCELNRNVDFPNFVGLTARDLGFEVELYRRKFADIDFKKSQLSIKQSLFNVPRLFEKLVPQSATSLPQSSKIEGLNFLADKNKKHKSKEPKKNKEHKNDGSKSHEKRKHKEKKNREPAPTLTPAIPLPPLLSPNNTLSEAVTSGTGVNVTPETDTKCFLKMNNSALAPIKTKSSQPPSTEPTKVADAWFEPMHFLACSEPTKSEAPPITPPPILEQAIPAKPSLPINEKPLCVEPLANESIVKEDNQREKRHKKEKKKEKKKKRDKEESRKRKHDQISMDTRPPPILEPVVQPAMSSLAPQPPPLDPPTTAATNTGSEVKPVQEISANVTSEDKSLIPANPPSVRLKIRIGSTLSSDSIRSSPTEVVASKPASASITPPLLTREAAPSDDKKLDPVSIKHQETKAAMTTADGEPLRKKHKSSKKEKQDKERDSFASNNGRTEREKHKKRSKEHKEKKERQKHGNSHPVLAPAKPASPSPVEAKPSSETPESNAFATADKSLKFKFNKNGLEQQAKTEKEDNGVKEAASVVKENQEKVEAPKRQADTCDEPSKHKRHKKEKKHKQEKESTSRASSSHSVKSLADRPLSSASVNKTPVLKTPSQTARPPTQAAANLKLFEPVNLNQKATPKKGAGTITKKEKPKPPTFSTLSALKAQTLNMSKSSAGSKSTSKKEPNKNESSSENKAEDSDVWICPICSVAYVDGAVDMIGCDDCNAWYHFACVGMLRPPPSSEDWFCQNCVTERRKKSKDRKKH